MAAKKKSARKKATRKSAALVPVTASLALPDAWEDELAAYVERDSASATGGTGWPFMGTRGGTFHYNGEEIDKEVVVVIVGAARVNAYYSEDYDPDSPSGPSCFAIDKDQNETMMAPPVELASKEAEACADCWANEFRSADKGKGKACKNGVRLCVLPYDMDGGNRLDKVEGARINIPPTSLKFWTAYSSKVTKGLRRPHFTMVCRIRLESDAKDQFHFTFEPEGLIQDDETLRTLKSRVDSEALANLYAEPQADSGGEGKKKKRVVKKKASGGRKKTARRTRAQG